MKNSDKDLYWYLKNIKHYSDDDAIVAELYYEGGFEMTESVLKDVREYNNWKREIVK